MSRRFYSWLLVASFLVCASELSFLTAWKLRTPTVESQVADIARLHEASVMVKTATGSGSGTIFLDSHGEFLILTAQHVVEGVTNAKLVQSVVLCGQKLYAVEIDSEVIAYDETSDLALLRPKHPKAFSQWVKHYAIIYKGRDVPKLGLPVIHVGSRLGVVGERSVSYGVISGIARTMTSDGAVLDQHTAPASPGSSGGGIFDARTGELLGILTRGYSDTFSFFVPVRQIQQFLENNLH